jgi:hypothetical protein
VFDSVLHWLNLPLSGGVAHEPSAWVAWHGRLMTLAWGVFAPVGILAARFWKRWPGQQWPQKVDHKGWWHLHRALQYGVLLATTAATAILLWHYGAPFAGLNSDSFTTPHRLMGWLLVAAMWLHVIGAWLRGSKGGPTETHLRGDHFDMTPRRQRFERMHKGLGWLLLVFSWATLFAGLMLADAPRWMPIVLLVWWSLLLGCAVRWQRQGRCIDTYQAIWGDRADLPGLQFAPIGWGVRRLKTKK